MVSTNNCDEIVPNCKDYFNADRTINQFKTDGFKLEGFDSAFYFSFTSVLIFFFHYLTVFQPSDL